MCLICGRVFPSVQKLREHVITHVQQSPKENTQNLFEKNLRDLEKAPKTVIKTEPCDENDESLTGIKLQRDTENLAKTQIKPDPEEFGDTGELGDFVNSTNEAFHGRNVGSLWDDVYKMIQSYDDGINTNDDDNKAANRGRFANILMGRTEANKTTADGSEWAQNVQL